MLGEDGLARCPWGDAPADYRAYHDDEWGRPVHGDDAIFERLSLEAYQAGLSWITILRRRPSFREAFAGFDIATVASFDDSMVERLATDARLIRHRGKASAVVSNARLLLRWQDECGVGVLDRLVWSFARQPTPAADMADVPVHTADSHELVRQLRARGWRFIGPTSAYAAMQAMGVVDDHLVGCHVRRTPTPSRVA